MSITYDKTVNEICNFEYNSIYIYRYMHDKKGSHFGQQKSFESVILSNPTEALTTSDFLVGITKGLLWTSQVSVLSL